ncbi:YtxH domain-containing protein [Paenibacillus camerounensis]|uniref:YtxH domain-containing protein n=1 Tax=Paenibacillus camerounensis TaxID=1243663 RepID=UPI000694EC98|nr:YtxH domain-containing protein [Paenibacillus camerounensis]
MKKDTKSLLWGILAGSVVGSVTALLFAPKPGKELRQDIADGTTAAVDKVTDIAGAAGEKSSELYGKAKDAVESVVSEVKEWSKQYTQIDAEEEIAVVSGIVIEEAAVRLDETDTAEIIAAAAEDAQDVADAGVESAEDSADAVLQDAVIDDKDGSI